MMMVITRVSLNSGAATEWDEAMRERINAAHGQQGWISGQLLTPADGSSDRVIVGTWQNQADWKAWHDDPAFKETRERLEGLQEGPDQMQWFEVVTEGREAGAG